MAGVVGLAQAILNGPEYGRPGKFTISVLEDSGGFFVVRRSRDFPWPESLSMSRQANYASVQIPGGTCELHQWTGTGGNDFSIEMKLKRDIRPSSGLPLLTALVVNPQSQENQAHNRDIQLDIDYLKQFILPTYQNTEGFLLPKPPPLCMLTFEGMAVGWGGEDYLLCVVDNIQTEYVRLFPDGTPRVANVTLSLKETFYDTSGNVVMQDRANLNVDRFAI